jgi:peptidoglycan/xylan/chitin deacetylase (PgdA/CDA1 family)
VTRIAILAYHKIGPPSPGGWDTWYYVPTETFEAQLSRVRELGFSIIDGNQFLDGLAQPEILPTRSVLITFDDAYRSLTTFAAPVLSRLGCPAVVFVPTGFVGDVNTFDADTKEPIEPICGWADLASLQQSGFSIQSHSVWHRPFSDLDPEQITEEVANSKLALEQRLGCCVDIFAFPYGDRGRDVGTVQSSLRHAGYRAACQFVGGAFELGSLDPFALSRVPMWRDTDVDQVLLG